MNNPYYPQYVQYPQGYQQNYQQSYQQNVQQNYPQSNQNNSIIWVQGEAGAKSFLVAPNATVQLWDSEAQTIYLKSADASGMPSIRILDYTFRDTHQNAPERSKSEGYVTKEEFHSFEEKIQKRLENLTQKAAENE